MAKPDLSRVPTLARFIQQIYEQWIDHVGTIDRKGRWLKLLRDMYLCRVLWNLGVYFENVCPCAGCTSIHAYHGFGGVKGLKWIRIWQVITPVKAISKLFIFQGPKTSWFLSAVFGNSIQGVLKFSYKHKLGLLCLPILRSFELSLQ